MNEYELLGSPGGNSSKDHVWRVATVGLIILVNQFSMFVIFPFLPFMVMYFFPDLPKEKVGFYAGYLGSSFFVGNVAASIFWGRLSDRAGRRPALLYATAGIIVTILIFGLSKTFAMAIIARFLWGAVNGNSGVAKTYENLLPIDSFYIFFNLYFSWKM